MKINNFIIRNCLQALKAATMIFMLVGISQVNQAYAADISWFSPCAEFDVIRFESGFEENFSIIEGEGGLRANINVVQAPTPCCQDAKALRSTLAFGKMNFEYEGGSSTDRGSEIITDPFNPNNKVLAFWIRNPNVMGPKGFVNKARVQTNVYNNKGIKRIKMTARLFLHPDFNLLSSYPSKIEWLTLSEWWNNASWSKENYPFRMSLNLYKDAGNAPLYFQVHGQALNTTTNKWDRTVWSTTNKQFPVPIGKWVTLEYEIVEGGKDKGRFVLSVTPDGEEKLVVLDVHDFTHHPDDPNPDGFNHFNPLKLYTSVPIVNFLTTRGAMLQLYWDDFSIVGAPN